MDARAPRRSSVDSLFVQLNKHSQGARASGKLTTLPTRMNISASAKNLPSVMLLDELESACSPPATSAGKGCKDGERGTRGAKSRPRPKRLALDRVSRKKAGNTQATRDFPWLLQTKSMEVFGSREADLSAREGAHRTVSYWKKESKRQSSALSSGTVHLTRSEAFKAHFCRAFAEARLGQDDMALADYSAAIEAIPTSGPAYFNRSEIHSRLGNYRAAIADLDAAIERDRAHRAEYYGNRALLHRKLGHFAQAMNDYEQAAMHKQLRANKRRTVKLFDNKLYNTAEEYRKLAALGKKDGRSALAVHLRSDLGSSREARLDDICALLRELVLFKSIPLEILKGLSRLAKYIEVPMGQYVFKQNDTGSSMYVILSGEVSVRKALYDPEAKKKRGLVASDDEDGVKDVFRGKSQPRKSVLDDLQQYIDIPPPEEEILARLRAGVSFGEIGDEAKGRDGEQAADGDKVGTLGALISESSTGTNPEDENDESGSASDLKNGLTSAAVTKVAKEADGPQQPALDSSQKLRRAPTDRRTRRRRASIFVEKDVELLVFETSASASLTLNAYRSWQIEHRTNAFRKSNVFASWNQEDLERLAKTCMLQQFASGSVLITQGKPVTELFFLECGVCRVSKMVDVAGPVPAQDHPVRATSYTAILEDSNAQKPLASSPASRSLAQAGLRPLSGEAAGRQASYREFEIGVIGCGQVAGEFSVLENHLEVPSPISVTAMTTVDALVITREDLSGIMPAFYGESMARMRESLRVNTKCTGILHSTFAENRNWEREKKKIVLSTVTMNNRLRRVQRELETSVKDQAEVTPSGCM